MKVLGRVWLNSNKMVNGLFHPGSGLGNMLHRYIATRVLALDKGYDFGMIGTGNFKGKSFMDIDFGILPPKEWNYLTDPSGKIIVDTHFDDTKEFNEKTTYYNPEFNFIKDNTIIDGEFQDERYFEHRLNEIDQWLTVEPIDIPDDVCVIGFRGGEFYVFQELGLPKSYFEEGIAKMREINPNMKFEVHTDDPLLARTLFPDFKITHDIGINWRSMRYARYAIIANSSFYILPRLLRNWDDTQDYWAGKDYTNAVTVAPRYWDRYNLKTWLHPYNYYKSFRYI